MLFSPLGATSVVLALASLVSGLGSTCTTPLGAGTAKSSDPFWLESMKHQGTATFNPNPKSYTVFRNVKDFGAVGDGVHDDTAAINAAITQGSRCAGHPGGGGCRSSTVTPALVYIPKGTYLVSAPIVPYYYTQLIGDAKNPPTLLADAKFDGAAVIDANPGESWTNQSNFFRSIRNFIIDVRRVPATKTQGTGIHWQVAQATSLMNIVFYGSTDANTVHRGIWAENGSGGFLGDLVFNGGMYGIWTGNQQFTIRNVTVNNAQTAIFTLWNWGYTYQGIKINNCAVGFDVASGAESLSIIDTVITNTPIFIRNNNPSNGTLNGALVINNAKLTNVPVAVGLADGTVILRGGSTTIKSWGQGNVYRGTNSKFTYTQGDVPAPVKPSTLLDSTGSIVSRIHPQYADYAVSQVVSAKSLGAKGDGVTDDTAALKDIFAKYSGCKIIFFDAGTYVVTDTVTIPAGTQMVGEAWTVLAGKGSNFQDMNNPRPLFKIGETGSQGIMEITDFVFLTIGPASGAILVEWNVKQPAGVQAGAGMWDSHIRLAGSAGTQLEGDKCPKDGSGGVAPCTAAFLALHLTTSSTAYIEGMWAWLADHDLDISGENMVTAYSGRGILSESQGPVWLIGTASEHHVLYQYSLANAANHYMGYIQTETPYYQPIPQSPSPFSINSKFHDPTPYSGSPSAWALHIQSSQNIMIFGAGLYNFFSGYTQDCFASQSCQAQIANIDTASTGINIYNLNTVASTFQLSVNDVGIINQSQNQNGFAANVMSWSQS